MTKTSVIALSLASVATAASAQGTAPAPAATGKAQRVYVINMERIYRESLLGKGYAKRLDDLKNELEAEKQKKQAELNKIDGSIKTLQEELEKQASLLSPEALDKKRQEVVRKNRERQAFFEDGQAELQRMEKRAQDQAEAMEAEYQVRIKPLIDSVVKDKGIDMLLDSRVALAFGKEYDISEEVILKSNEAERAAKAAATPKPGEKPAEKPAPTTTTPPPAAPEKP